MQLAGSGGAIPRQLSGGQRQRVALARALAIEPKLLLLDEPFGALDAKVRKELRRWLRELHDRTGVTTIFVTHDQEEALELADRVVVLRDGRIEQQGNPAALVDAPATAFVSSFLGDVNRLPCTVTEANVVEVAGLRLPADTTRPRRRQQGRRRHPAARHPAAAGRDDGRRAGARHRPAGAAQRHHGDGGGGDAACPPTRSGSRPTATARTCRRCRSAIR